jgi:muramoyltetrapeptide carboxypeptidase
LLVDRTEAMLSRRDTVWGLAASLGVLAVPGPAPGRAPSRLKRLKVGDAVGLIAPASSDDDPTHLENAIHTVSGMGLVPKPGLHESDRYGYLSGTDRDRAADINTMFADDTIKALFTIRGGWGAARLLPLLDWKLIRSHPKWLVGFSDATSLHLAFAARAGFPTIHAPNVGNRWDTISWESFWDIAFNGQAPLLGEMVEGDGTQERWRRTTIRGGKARGRLIGGNLTVLSTLMGTPWLPDLDGAILFLEDVGEAEYRIDRMLTQLALAGVLAKVAGVIFGQCTRCTSDYPDYDGFTVPQILEQHLSSLGVPAFWGANIGHVANQLSLPVGARVEMDANAGTIRLLQPIAT